MSALSANDVLRKARALCLDVGIDPDQTGEDGKPLWLSLVSEARASLKIEQQSNDPLASLEAIERRDIDGEVVALTQSHSAGDPLESLQALFEHEVAAGHHANGRPDGSPADLPTEGVPTPRPNKDADPLEELRAIELATTGRNKGDRDAADNFSGFDE